MSSSSNLSLSRMQSNNQVAFNVAFVEIIEKHPCLWNFNSPGYLKKDFVESTWNRIAELVSDTVPNCQVRWKSIRQAFARTLKPSFSVSGQKKEYYLAPHLGFIMPFLRCCSAARLMPTEEVEDLQQESVDFIKVENESVQECSYEISERNEGLAEYDEGNGNQDQDKQAPKIFSSKKRGTDPWDWEQAKKTRFNEVNASIMFLQSLTPFLDEMNSKQNRRFRRKVMNLIDDVLEDADLAGGEK